MAQDEIDAFNLYVSMLPPTNCPILKKKRKLTVMEYVAALVDSFEWNQRIKELCKTKVLFRLKGDDKHSFRVIRHENCKEVREYIDNTYGEDLVEIANES